MVQLFIVTQNKTLKGSENCVFVNCQHKPKVYTAACTDERKTFCGKYSNIRLFWCDTYIMCIKRIFEKHAKRRQS